MTGAERGDAAPRTAADAVDVGMAPSELETMIGETVQRLFSDHVSPELLDAAEAGAWPGALWSLVDDSGLPKALCAAEAGGSGARWLDAYPVFAGIGRWSVPLPLAATMVAGWLLGLAGVDVPQGPVAIAPAAASLSLAGVAGAGVDRSLLDGTLDAVPWAGRCRWLLASVAGASGPCVLVDLSAPSVERCESHNMAGEPRAQLRFGGTPVCVAFANPLPLLEDPLLQLGALSHGAMLVGALERALDLSVAYANERVQFGKALARYQVLQHGLAAVAGELVAARVATRVAFASLHAGAGGRTSAFDIAVAKVRCGQAASRMAALAHQIHGAIGFTREHALQRSTRRLWSWRQEFGSDAAWAAVLGRAAIARGGADFWPALCERRLGAADGGPSPGP